MANPDETMSKGHASFHEFPDDVDVDTYENEDRDMNINKLSSLEGDIIRDAALITVKLRDLATFHCVSGFEDNTLTVQVVKLLTKYH